MNRKECVILITASLLFTSCSTKSLRSDIKEFIASFSFDEAVKTRTEGGYDSIKISTEDEYVFKEVIHLEYSYSDNSNLKYDFLRTVYHDDTITQVNHNYLEYENDTIYYVTGEIRMEYDLQKSTDLIRTFFYTKSNEDPVYRYGGMYYGDYLLEMARILQDWITIDQEKQLLIYDIERDGKNQQGEKEYAHEKYSVDKLGMLVELTFEAQNGDKISSQKINVF